MFDPGLGIASAYAPVSHSHLAEMAAVAGDSAF